MHRWQSTVLLGLLLIVAAVAGGDVGGGRSAHAATTRVWIGAAATDLWSAPTNWSPTGAPVDGDSVVFPAATPGSNQNNDLGFFDVVNNRFVPLRLASLTLNKGVLLVGSRLAISSTISVGVPSIQPDLNLPLELAGNVQMTVAGGSRLRLWSGGGFAQGTVALDMAGHNLTKTGEGSLEVNQNLLGGGTFAMNGGPTTLRNAFPVAFSGTMAMGPGTRLTFAPGPLTTPAGPGPCGAPSAAIVLDNAAMSVTCPASVGSVSGTGSIDVAGPVPRLTIAVKGESFQGPIGGGSTAAIFCCKQGVQTFRGASTFTGNVYVTGGTLTFDGATFPGAARFTVQGEPVSRPSLAGFGTFGETILTTANLALRPVNGKFGLARFPTLQFAPSVAVVFEIEGAAPGTEFTQIVMSGEIFLDDAGLLVSFGGYAPTAGQAFTLITGATALLGTFSNVQDGKPLVEGATFTAEGMQFKITYKGGAGRDVVITRQGAAATPTPTPSPTPGGAKFKRFVPMVARDN